MKNQMAIGLVILMSGGLLLGMQASGYDMQKVMRAYSSASVQENSETVKEETVKEETSTSAETETMTETMTQEKTTQEQQIKQEVSENIEQESTSAEKNENAEKKDNSIMTKSDFEGTNSISMFGKQKAVSDGEKIEQIKDLICRYDLKSISEAKAKSIQKEIEDRYGISLFLSFKNEKDKVLKEINLLPYLEDDGYYIKVDDKIYKVTNEAQDVQTIKESIHKIFDEVQ